MTTLAGHSTFVTSSTSRWLVRLPQDVATKDISTTFSGDGRVIGFFFVDANEPLERAAMLHGQAIGRCKKRACKARKPNFRFTFRWNISDTLPKGLYEVYVLADGAPVTFEIDLDGLYGRKELRGGTAVPSVIETLPGRMSEDNQVNVYSAGNFVEPGRIEPDFGLVGVWAIGTDHVATAFGDCYYYPGDLNTPPREEIAFLPHCPTGDSFEHHFVSQEPLQDDGFVYVSGNFGGPTGIGGWYSSASIPEEYGAVAAWVDLTN
ncbi:MAG: hypothetical protein ACRD1R_02980 [Acidobacteriota bacterium]